jgi:hypothetical protein
MKIDVSFYPFVFSKQVLNFYYAWLRYPCKLSVNTTHCTPKLHCGAQETNVAIDKVLLKRDVPAKITQHKNLNSSSNRQSGTNRLFWLISLLHLELPHSCNTQDTRFKLPILNPKTWSIHRRSLSNPFSSIYHGPSRFHGRELPFPCELQHSKFRCQSTTLIYFSEYLFVRKPTSLSEAKVHLFTSSHSSSQVLDASYVSLYKDVMSRCFDVL